MQRRRTRSLSPERAEQLEEPKLSWRNITAHFVTLQGNVDMAQARVKEFSDMIAGHQEQLAGDEDSLAVAEIFHIAQQFRSDTREYTAALEEVLDCQEQDNISMSTALERAAPASSEEELSCQRRLLLSQLLQARRQRPRLPGRALASVESSSSQSDLSSRIPLEKPKRRLWLKQKGASKEDAVEEFENVALGLTDHSRGVPVGRTSSIRSLRLRAFFSRHGVGRSSIAHGSGGAASSGDSETGGCAASGVGSEEPADKGGKDQESNSSLSSMTPYRSATSATIPAFHSATSGDEADEEPDTTTPATSTTPDASNANSNSNSESNSNGNEIGMPSVKIIAHDKSSVEGDGNANISNAQISVQSTSQTDGSRIEQDRLEQANEDKLSSLSGVVRELSRQQDALRLLLQRHVERLESQRLARLHLEAQTPPRRASRLLRAQLRLGLRTVAAEVGAAERALLGQGAALLLLAAKVWHSQPAGGPQWPQPEAASRPATPPPPPPQQPLAVVPHRARRPPLLHAMQRARAFLRRLFNRR